jgi:YfiH family protein
MTKTFFGVEVGYDIEKKGDSLPFFQQVHGKTVLELKPSSQAPDSISIPEADAGIAYLPLQSVWVYTADCFPILFFTEDPMGPIAAAHAGWRGIKQGIVKETLLSFSSQSRVHVAIGPAIGKCCFSVRNDFIEEWESASLSPQRFCEKSGDRIFFDLWTFLRQRDLASIPDDRIHLDLFRCTACSSPALPSFRREKSANPRIRSWIKRSD